MTNYYWDTCAWLGLLNGEQDKRRELEIIFKAAEAGSCEIWTSAISLVETNHLSNEKGTPKPWSQENAEKIGNLFRQDFVKMIPLDVEIGNRAREIIRTTKLGNKFDAAHVSSAIRWNLEVIHTYDRNDLLEFDRKFETLAGDAIEICYPDRHTDGPLFEAVK